LYSSRLNLGLYRNDVNVVWDLAPHDITIMNYLLNSVPTTVSAWGASLAAAPVEDVAYIRLDYEQLGVCGFIQLSWLDPRKNRTVTVVGREKMAVYDDIADEKLRIFDRGISALDRRIAGLDGGTRAYEQPLSYRYGDIVSPHLSSAEPLALEDQHFVDCVRKRVDPGVEGGNGMIVVAILEAIDRAIATGAPVRVRHSSERAGHRKHVAPVTEAHPLNAKFHPSVGPECPPIPVAASSLSRAAAAPQPRRRYPG
jgi:predicted dehydrogenase